MDEQRIRELQEAYAVAGYDRMAWAIRVDASQPALQAHLDVLDTKKAEILFLLMKEENDVSPNPGTKKRQRYGSECIR